MKYLIKALCKLSSNSGSLVAVFGPLSPTMGLLSPLSAGSAAPLPWKPLPGEPSNQGRAGETAGDNWRLLDFWNEGYTFENGSAWERESIVGYKYLFQRSPEHETSSSVIQVRFQGSSIVGVLSSAVVFSSKVFCLTSSEFILVNESMFIFEECPCLDKKRFFIIMKRLATLFSQTAFCSPEFHLMNEKNYGDFWNQPNLQGALLKRTTGLTLNALYHSSGKFSLLGGPYLSDIKRSEVKMQGLPFLLQHNSYPLFSLSQKTSKASYAYVCWKRPDLPKLDHPVSCLANISLCLLFMFFFLSFFLFL